MTPDADTENPKKIWEMSRTGRPSKEKPRRSGARHLEGLRTHTLPSIFRITLAEKAAAALAFHSRFKLVNARSYPARPRGIRRSGGGSHD